MDDLAAWARALEDTRPASDDGVLRICRLCVPALGVGGGGVSLVTTAGARGLVCATDDIAFQVEELQFSLGEGPCTQAEISNRPVLVADVNRTRDEHVRNWPTFAARAVALGVGALFAFPLRRSGVSLGALDLYRLTPGPLSESELRGALMAADSTTAALLAMGPDDRTEPSAADAETMYDLQVHQATGMVMVQLGVTSADALSTLRARAFALDLPLTTIARDVVDRRLRFTQEEE